MALGSSIAKGPARIAAEYFDGTIASFMSSFGAALMIGKTSGITLPLPHYPRIWNLTPHKLRNALGHPKKLSGRFSSPLKRIVYQAVGSHAITSRTQNDIVSDNDSNEP